MTNTYLVTLWKFDEHQYKEQKVLLRYDPAYVDKGKPTLLGILRQVWKEWRK